MQKSDRENEACQRLTEIPEVGPITATALIATVGNAKHGGQDRELLGNRADTDATTS
jgi:transposase